MLRKLLAAVFPPSNVKRFVGVDHLGNRYYEIEKADGKKKRLFERDDDFRPEDYVHGVIPNQWEAWIRGRIDTPPTVMELLEREKNEKLIARRGEELAKKDDEVQRKAYEDGLIARASSEAEASKSDQRQFGHASSHFFGPKEQTREPSTISGNFEPGTWRPTLRNAQSEKEQGGDEGFQPESWSPPKQKR